jgi:uncharacterized protein YijF (DUF1287 family)
MELNNIELGDRKVQYNNGAHILNIPNTAVRVMNIKAGDVMRWELVDGILHIQRVEAVDTNESL